MRRVKQFFTDEYLESCKGMKPEQIIEFLNHFMEVHTTANDPTKLISLKIKSSLLESFKSKSKSQGLKYQSQIKKLMEDWVVGSGR